MAGCIHGPYHLFLTTDETSRSMLNDVRKANSIPATGLSCWLSGALTSVACCNCSTVYTSVMDCTGKWTNTIAQLSLPESGGVGANSQSVGPMLVSSCKLETSSTLNVWAYWYKLCASGQSEVMGWLTNINYCMRTYAPCMSCMRSHCNHCLHLYSPTPLLLTWVGGDDGLLVTAGSHHIPEFIECCPDIYCKYDCGEERESKLINNI